MLPLSAGWLGGEFAGAGCSVCSASFGFGQVSSVSSAVALRPESAVRGCSGEIFDPRLKNDDPQCFTGDRVFRSFRFVQPCSAGFSGVQPCSGLLNRDEADPGTSAAPSGQKKRIGEWA
jgi:hypothetical protein